MAAAKQQKTVADSLAAPAFDMKAAAAEMGAESLSSDFSGFFRGAVGDSIAGHIEDVEVPAKLQETAEKAILRLTHPCVVVEYRDDAEGAVGQSADGKKYVHEKIAKPGELVVVTKHTKSAQALSLPPGSWVAISITGEQRIPGRPKPMKTMDVMAKPATAAIAKPEAPAAEIQPF